MLHLETHIFKETTILREKFCKCTQLLNQIQTVVVCYVIKLDNKLMSNFGHDPHFFVYT